MSNSTSRYLNPAKNYHFVTEQEPGQPSQIRRHVAKERWRQRKAPGLARFQRKTPRSLVSMLPHRLTSTAFPKESNSRCDEWNSETPGGKYIKQKQCVREEHNNSTGSRVPGSLSHGPSPYQSLGHAELDPFNGIHLSREDQNLLHHWTNVYAYRAFGQPNDSTFLGLSNAYVPIDLSNEASTHASLAHSASHMAYLKGVSTSVPALHHKSAAIKLINEALNDPEIAVSDGILAAVLRLLSLENFWGNKDAMRFHQEGLNRLVEQRGGLEALRGNWRLEMRILLVPLLWKRLSPSTQVVPTHKFINVFRELSVPGPEISANYPAIGRAMEHLKCRARTPTSGLSDQHLPDHEIDRLMCMVYISFACTPMRQSSFDLNLLNEFLKSTEHLWFSSTSILRWLLTQSVGKGPAGLRDAKRTGQFDEVTKLVTLSSQQSLMKHYLKYFG